MFFPRPWGLFHKTPSLGLTTTVEFTLHPKSNGKPIVCYDNDLTTEIHSIVISRLDHVICCGWWSLQMVSRNHTQLQKAHLILRQYIKSHLVQNLAFFFFLVSWPQQNISFYTSPGCQFVSRSKLKSLVLTFKCPQRIQATQSPHMGQCYAPEALHTGEPKFNRQ